MLRILVLSLAFAASVFGQAFDKSGNSQLAGSYNFRQVVWGVDGTGTGNLFGAEAIYGTMTFDGVGTYRLSGTCYGCATSGTSAYSTTGSYAFTAAGFGYMDSPLGGGLLLYGMVTNGTFIGSSTDAPGQLPYNDLAVAAPQSSISSSLFTSKYNVADINFPSGDITQARSANFVLQPNGAGTIGSTTVTGFIGPAGKFTQSLSGATYTLTGGIGTLTYPGTFNAANSLEVGTRTFYISPDGNLIFGGSPSGFDFFVGVKAPASGNTAPESVSGLYYHAGISVDESTVGAGKYAEMLTYYGAVNYTRGAVADDQTAVVPIGHMRQLSGFAGLANYPSGATDYTYSDQYSPNSDGSFFYLSESRFASPDGRIIIGSGFSQFLGLEIAVKAPSFQGTGVYLNPSGIQNAASFAPFTTGLSRGEFLTVFGTNLAPGLEVSTSFPRTLRGVQVLINGRPAPLYYVSPTQISLIVPYSTTEIIATVQVVNNGTLSNSTTLYVNNDTPGIFMKPTSGFGRAASLHADYTEITPQSPAHPGETIQVFMAGLGDVTPPITEGDLSGANNTTSLFGAAVDGITATVTYSGLAPQLVGLYQMNVTIPTGVRQGNVYLDIFSVNSFNSQAQIPISTSATGSSLPVTPLTVRSHVRRPANSLARQSTSGKTRPKILLPFAQSQ